MEDSEKGTCSLDEGAAILPRLDLSCGSSCEIYRMEVAMGGR